jgi:hypothetical protein
MISGVKAVVFWLVAILGQLIWPLQSYAAQPILESSNFWALVVCGLGFITLLGLRWDRQIRIPDDILGQILTLAGILLGAVAPWMNLALVANWGLMLTLAGWVITHEEVEPRSRLWSLLPCLIPCVALPLSMSEGLNLWLLDTTYRISANMLNYLQVPYVLYDDAIRFENSPVYRTELLEGNFSWRLFLAFAMLHSAVLRRLPIEVLCNIALGFLTFLVVQLVGLVGRGWLTTLYDGKYIAWTEGIRSIVLLTITAVFFYLSFERFFRWLLAPATDPLSNSPTQVNPLQWAFNRFTATSTIPKRPGTKALNIVLVTLIGCMICSQLLGKSSVPISRTQSLRLPRQALSELMKNGEQWDFHMVKGRNAGQVSVWNRFAPGLRSTIQASSAKAFVEEWQDHLIGTGWMSSQSEEDQALNDGTRIIRMQMQKKHSFAIISVAKKQFVVIQTTYVPFSPSKSILERELKAFEIVLRQLNGNRNNDVSESSTGLSESNLQ